MVVRIMEAKVLGEDPQQAVERTERFVTLARMGELHDRFLDANSGGAVGREMMLGLGLGVVLHQQKPPSEHNSDGFKTAQQEAGGYGERVETMEWRMLGGNNGNGGGVIMEEEALATEQGKEIAAMMVESSAIDFRDDREGETVKTEEGEGEGVVVVDSWRIESFDSMQAAEENRRAGSDCEHWRSEIGPAAPRLQEWSHKAGDTNSNSNPIANVNANGNVAEQEMKPKSLQGEECGGGHVLYWECQRNLAVGKGTAAVYDGCGEFLPAVGDGTAVDALKCAACNCHRSFHRRIILGRDESAWEERERQLREGDETLFAIRQAATDIKASAGRALPLLSQDLHRQKRLPIKDIRASEYVSVLKSCVEAMGQNASALLAVSDCLSLLHHLGGVHPDIDGKQEVLLKGLPTANAIVLPNNASVSKQSEPSMVFPSAFYHPSSLCWQNGMMFSALSNQSMEMGFVDHRQKRKRTRFSFEQLQKLNDFATRMGWTLAGVPKEDIDTLCLDVGIEAVTLKYWIHNTRQKSKRKFNEDGNRTPPRTP